MKRIIVIGCGEAGKSTFSRKLSNKLYIPVYHLDKLFEIKDGWKRLKKNLIVILKFLITEKKLRSL